MRRICVVLAGLGTVGIVWASVLTLADIALRTAGVSVLWPYEVSALLLTVSISTFFPLVFLDDRNLTIRYLGDFLGGSWRRALDLFGSIGALLFIALVAGKLVGYAVDVTEFHETTPMARLPVYPVWFAVALMTVAAVVAQLVIVLRLVRGGDASGWRDGQ